MIVLRNKLYSRKKNPGDREIVPKDIAEKGRKEGVIQQDKNGKWRIISYKTDPPTFWNSTYETKEKAEESLRAYQANKNKGK